MYMIAFRKDPDRGAGAARPGSGRGRARSLAAALAGLATALLFAGPARAQTVQTLVSNIDQSGGDSVDIGANDQIAQKFTVGPASHYTLDTVEFLSPAGLQKQGVTVRIHRVSENVKNPGDRLYNLSPRDDNFAERRTYDAPDDAVLGKGRSYFVVFNRSINVRRNLGTTDSDEEDSASLAGWSIADGLRRKRGNGSWQNLDDPNPNPSIRIKLQGTELANAPAMGAPVISGPPQVDETLTADLSGIIDYDDTTQADAGAAGYDYTYQWIRVDSDDNETSIPGATGNTYTPVAADVGHKLKVQVSFTDDEDNDEGPLTSEPYPSQGFRLDFPSIVAAKGECPDDADWCAEMTVGRFTRGGGDFFGYRRGEDNHREGSRGSFESRTFDYGGKGFAVLQVTFWFGNAQALLQIHLNRDVPEGSRFSIDGVDRGLNRQADPGQYSNGVSGVNWVVGQKVAVGVKFGNFPAEGKPAVTGSPQVGQELEAATGGISDPDGLGAYSYQWIRVDSDGESNPVDIGTDSDTYTLVDADEGKKVRVKVSFTDDRDNAEGPLTSDAFPEGHTIVAAGANIPPVFASARHERELAETVGAATVQSPTNLGVAITATDDDNDSISYSLAGDRASKFMVDANGQLRTMVGKSYDYEDPQGNIYVLSLTADDGKAGGTASAQVVINITNNENEQPLAPDAPEVTAASGDPTSLEVRWNAPDNTGRPDISGYDVRYQATTATGWTNGPQNLSDTTRLATLTGLAEDTAYRAQVRAQNTDGDGAWSVSGEGRTARPGDVSVAFGTPQYTAREGGPAVRVTVTLAEPRSQAFTIPLTVTRLGGATAADYSGVPASVTLPGGQTVATFDVTATDDADDDDGESMRLGFGTLPSGVVAGSPATATIGLADNDIPLMVRFDEERYPVREGVGTARISLILNRAPTGTLRIPLTAVPLDGATSADYSGVPASVTFTAGERVQRFEVTATVDAVDDDGESVRLGFGTLPAGVVAGIPDAATIILRDQDARDASLTVRFEAESYYVREGIGRARITAVLNQPPGRALEIAVVTTPGGGASAADYDGVSATLAFGPSDTRASFAVGATRDAVNDDGEYLEFAFGTLPAEVATARPSAAILYLVDEQGGERLVSFIASDYATGEGNHVLLSLRLSRPARTAVTIPLTTTHRGGASVHDYSGVPASVSFAAGQALKNISIAIVSDDLDDDGESIVIGLGALASGYAPGKHPRVVIELLDADGRRTWEVWFGQSTYTVVEGGAAAEVTVGLNTPWKPWLNEPLVLPIGAEYRGGATRADHSRLPPRLTIPAGATTASFSISAVDDNENDDGESIVVGLRTPLPEELRLRDGPDQATVWLEDDDGPPAVTVAFDASVYTAAEGGADAEVTVRLDRQPERELEIPLYVSRRGGAGGADYSGVPESLTFSAGQTSRQFTVTATDDSVDDDDESLELRFGPLPEGVSAGSRSRTVINLADNDGSAQPESRVVYFGGSGGTSRVREGGSFFVDMYLDPPVTGSLSIPLTVTHLGGATAADYEGMPDTVTFANGEKRSGFVVTVLENREQDPGKGLRAEFGALPAGVRAGVSGRGLSRTLWFIDNDGPPRISVADASTRERPYPQAYLVFEVRLDRLVEDEVRVDYQTEDGTAVAGTAVVGGDYKAESGTLVFERHADSKHVGVLVRFDEEVEDTETMTLRLSNAVGGQITDGVAEGRIRDFGSRAAKDAGVAGTLLTLRYDGDLDQGSTPSPRDFVVAAEAPGGARAMLAVESVAVQGSEVRLRLERPVAPEETVALDYLPAAMHPILDADGLPAAPLADEPVRNDTDADGLLPDAELPAGFAPAAALAVVAEEAPEDAETALLDLSSRNLTDLSALAGRTGLRELDLRHNALTDLGPLAGLAGLRVLHLDGNRITDLAPLAGLAGLERLSLAANRIADLRPLAALAGLERLDLAGNRVADLAPLTGLAGLEVPLLDRNRVADLLALSPLQGLASLGLAGNQIADIGLLTQFGGLRRLDLSDNAVADVSALGDVPGLVWLRLPGNPVSNAVPLGRLHELRWLWLDADTTAETETLAPPAGRGAAPLWIERMPAQ